MSLSRGGKLVEDGAQTMKLRKYKILPEGETLLYSIQYQIIGETQTNYQNIR